MQMSSNEFLFAVFQCELVRLSASVLVVVSSDMLFSARQSEPDSEQ